MSVCGLDSSARSALSIAGVGSPIESPGAFAMLCNMLASMPIISACTNGSILACGAPAAGSMAWTGSAAAASMLAAASVLISVLRYFIDVSLQDNFNSPVLSLRNRRDKRRHASDQRLQHDHSRSGWVAHTSQADVEAAITVA